VKGAEECMSAMSVAPIAPEDITGIAAVYQFC